MRVSLLILLAVLGWCAVGSTAHAVNDSSPLPEKAEYFQRNLLEKHWLDGLYVSIVPTAADGVTVPHTVNEPGNVIHAGVWTGRYLAGVGYQYAVTNDPAVRRLGGQILVGLRRLQEVTGKPGLLARGYVEGHGPVMGYERDGSDSPEWHQGQGEYANFRWYGDVSVDNFNAVLYGYAIYYDLAADEEQKSVIAHDVDRLMTHLLDHHCRIVDVDGEVTRYGHVGIDPDPSRETYYTQQSGRLSRRYGADGVAALPLRAQMMLLPDLLIAHHVTGKQRYLDFYRRVVDRFKDNPERPRSDGSQSPRRRGRVNHSSEGQRYEAMYNLIRYEHDPELLALYRTWVDELWEANWSEGNSLFTYMTLVLLPEYVAPAEPGRPAEIPAGVSHAAESLSLANRTLEQFPIDRVLRPVMNSLRKDIELSPLSSRSREKRSATPLPMNQRPLDNEYEWKGDPYRVDGWLKPTISAMQLSADDPQVAWLCDSRGRIHLTLDHGRHWQDVTSGMMGASVRNISASKTRTFVLWAETDRGILITRDGGLGWREAPADGAPEFTTTDFRQWHPVSDNVLLRINENGILECSRDGGSTSEPAMNGWRIPLATSLFMTPWGAIASGPGGTYLSSDGQDWNEWTVWDEYETGAADFLHAYWMGRYYGFVHE